MNRSFTLSCESTVDLPFSYVDGRDIPVLFYSYLVDGKEYPDDMLRETGKVVRSICLLDHPVKGTGDCKSAQIIIPAKQIERAGYPKHSSGRSRTQC